MSYQNARSYIKARLQDRENWVRTRQKIGPDLTNFVEKQSNQNGAIGAYGPVKGALTRHKILGTDSSKNWSEPVKIWSGPNHFCRETVKSKRGHKARLH